MSDPFTIASFIMGGFKIGSAVMEHKAAQEATDYNSKIAAEQSAQIAVERDQQLEQQKRSYRLSSGTNIARAAAGEGGVSGSTFDLLADNASQNALDLLTISQNAAYSQQKVRADDELSRMKTSPTILGTAGKILTSAGQTYTQVKNARS